jgi:hypothetical protein
VRWRPVVGYEDYYEVSDEGCVRSTKGWAMRSWLNKQGYALVRLANPRRIIRVHRIVAEAFICNPNCLPFVNHLDCNRSNNIAVNLEWCTQWQNLDHSQRLGRMQRDYWVGKRSPSAKLTDEQATAIRGEYARGGKSWAAIGTDYGISKRTVGRIIQGESYV